MARRTKKLTTKEAFESLIAAARAYVAASGRDPERMAVTVDGREVTMRAVEAPAP